MGCETRARERPFGPPPPRGCILLLLYTTRDVSSRLTCTRRSWKTLTEYNYYIIILLLGPVVVAAGSCGTDVSPCRFRASNYRRRYSDRLIIYCEPAQTLQDTTYNYTLQWYGRRCL